MNQSEGKKEKTVSVVLHEERVVSSNQLKPGDVLSRSIFSWNDSRLLYGKNFRLTEAACINIRANGIKQVYLVAVDDTVVKATYTQNLNVTPLRDGVKKALIPPEKQPAPDLGNPGVETLTVPLAVASLPESTWENITQREEYKRFETDYLEKEEKLGNTIKEISDGAQIDVQHLYSLTGDVMDSLENKSDVLSYVGNLQVKDEYTYSHSANVALIANLFGRWMGFSPSQLVTLTTAGLLHDVGKIAIPDAILNKKGRLTDDEFRIMTTHTLHGYQTLKDKDVDVRIKLVALQHHEKLDGSGYPQKLKDNDIDAMSKIMAICDIYDAMTANRVYRPKICPFEVIAQFEKMSFGALDRHYLSIFLSNLANNFLGSNCVLSDGSRAEVLFINKKSYSRPTVIIDGKPLELIKYPEISIVAVH